MPIRTPKVQISFKVKKGYLGADTLSHITVLGYRSDFVTACNRSLFTLSLPMLHYLSN